MKAFVQLAVVILAIPGGLWLAFKVAGLDKVRQLGMAAGKKFLTDPLQGGARRASGSIAHWGAGRGFVGRTAARIATGAIYPGGRAQMERLGEAHRKATSERTGARGSYRLTPSSRMNADALEKASVDAIQRWVNNPSMQGDVESLRRMVADTPTIRLSTAQREALFSGVGGAPTVGPIAPGAPSRIGAVPLPDTDRPVGGQSAVGRWWSDRPSLLPGIRQASTRRGVLGLGGVAAHYLGGGGRQWAGWIGRAFGRAGGPRPPAPPPNPPSAWPAP